MPSRASASSRPPLTSQPSRRLLPPLATVHHLSPPLATSRHPSPPRTASLPALPLIPGTSCCPWARSSLGCVLLTRSLPLTSAPMGLHLERRCSSEHASCSHSVLMHRRMGVHGREEYMGVRVERSTGLLVLAVCTRTHASLAQKRNLVGNCVEAHQHTNGAPGPRRRCIPKLTYLHTLLGVREYGHTSGPLRLPHRWRRGEPRRAQHVGRRDARGDPIWAWPYGRLHPGGGGSCGGSLLAGRASEHAHRPSRWGRVGVMWEWVGRRGLVGGKA